MALDVYFITGGNLVRMTVTCCMVIFQLNVITFARSCVISDSLKSPLCCVLPKITNSAGGVT